MFTLLSYKKENVLTRHVSLWGGWVQAKSHNSNSKHVLLFLYFPQNILELKVCDEDKHTADDHLLTVFFDVSKIQLGETVRLNFQLNPKVCTKLLKQSVTLEKRDRVFSVFSKAGFLILSKKNCNLHQMFWIMQREGSSSLGLLFSMWLA